MASEIMEPNAEALPRIPSPEEMSSQLAVLETEAETALTDALGTVSVSPDVSAQYAQLFPTRVEEAGDTTGKLSLAIVGRTLWEDVRHNRLTQLILSGLAVSTAARIAEAHGVPSPLVPATADLTILLDNLLKWSGSSVKAPLDLLSVLNAVGSAAVYLGLPVKGVEIISAIQSRITIEKVRQQAEALKVRAQQEQGIREGTANFDGKVGANIQIDVGKSDPSMGRIIKLFHAAGLPIVSYWDTLNKFFESIPAWQRTNNDWTNKEILRRGDVREALLSIVLVSNGDDVFLSSRRQDPTRKMQDMTDSEAIETVHARDAVREQMGLPKMPHIIVTNGKRTIEVGVARSGEAPYQPKTVGEIVDSMENVYLIDPDELIIQQIASIANEQDDLPIELVTNTERREEYQENLEKSHDDHNKKVDSGKRSNKTKMASPKDGKKTLTLMYGSTDEDTIAQVTAYRKEFTREGDLVAIINDPEKLNRLPEGIKSVCIGAIVADAIYQKFFELVSQGSIVLPEK